MRQLSNHFKNQTVQFKTGQIFQRLCQVYVSSSLIQPWTATVARNYRWKFLDHDLEVNNYVRALKTFINFFLFFFRFSIIITHLTFNDFNYLQWSYRNILAFMEYNDYSGLTFSGLVRDYVPGFVHLRSLQKLALSLPPKWSASVRERRLPYSRR